MTNSNNNNNNKVSKLYQLATNQQIIVENEILKKIKKFENAR